MAYDEAAQLWPRRLPTIRCRAQPRCRCCGSTIWRPPSPYTRFGQKGIGEGGAIGPPAAIANAVNDALATLGARVDRPADHAAPGDGGSAGGAGMKPVAFGLAVAADLAAASSPAGRARCAGDERRAIPRGRC
ncbi:MAG: hypothetical protein WDN49_16645 [Acetobacteraceae bacterium]